MVSKTCVMYRSGSRRSVDLQNTSNCPHNWSKFTRIIKVKNWKSAESLFRVASLSLNFREWFGKLFEIWGTDRSLPWVPVELKIRKIIWHVFLIDVFSKPLSLKTKNLLSLRRFPPTTKNPLPVHIFSTFHLGLSPVLHKVSKLTENWSYIVCMLLNLKTCKLYGCHIAELFFVIR